MFACVSVSVCMFVCVCVGMQFPTEGGAMVKQNEKCAKNDMVYNCIIITWNVTNFLHYHHCSFHLFH